MFAKNKRGDNSRSAAHQKLMRPAADFMTDEALSEMVPCTKCNEPLIKAFVSDHICNAKTLSAHQTKQSAQEVDPLTAFRLPKE